MYALLYRLGRWLLTKLGVALGILVAVVVVYAAWLYIQDDLRTEAHRAERLAALQGERERIEAVRAAVEQQVAALRAEADVQRDRVQRAEKVMSTLRELESWWDRWFGNREQQTANQQQLARMQALRDGATAKATELVELARSEEARLPALQAEAQRVEAELTRLAAAESRWMRYVRSAWTQLRGYLLVVLLVYFAGPSVLKTFGYFVWAPLLARGRPIQFNRDPAPLPEVTPSRVSLDLPLWPGEVLRVKEGFLQASDEALARRTRFVLDWRIPFTSVACGLVELVEMRHNHAGGEQRVTFSSMDDPHAELALITVPEGGSLILRPSFLAGVVTALNRPLVIRRRWALFRWQAWVSLQFRYFEFIGPCRLIVVGNRGVRAERLETADVQRRPARRTNQRATIGFTPTLEYLPVRAETFWAYYRDHNPLFDDLFAGTGVFVLQETGGAGEAARAGRFWSAWWNGVLKVFGL